MCSHLSVTIALIECDRRQRQENHSKAHKPVSLKYAMFVEEAKMRDPASNNVETKT